MRTMILNLYKVKADDWNNSAYAAATDQQEAIAIVSMDFPDMNCAHASVTYVGEVYVPETNKSTN